MSNALAIAAVTATLRNLLDQAIAADMPDASVTTKPLDKVSNGSESGNRVNLFLYQTVANAAWRNMDMPVQTKPGETSLPPLALSLYYLITAYGKNDDDTLSHRLLGRAMGILHDQTILDRTAIEAALPGNDLHRQVESVRITPQPLSLDEMSKLWSAFQTQYRISAAYQISVVLIESTLPPKSALPVLARGDDNRGVNVLSAASPVLLEVQLPNRKSSAELGDTIAIRGEQLSRDLTLRFRHALLTEAIALNPLPDQTATELQIKLPEVTAADVPARWPAGFYSISGVVPQTGLPPLVTNELPLTLAPQITQITPTTAAQGDVLLTLTCLPQVQPEQRVLLLVGDRQLTIDSLTTPASPTAPTTLTFRFNDASPGSYLLRLRVDGVDSIPIDFTTRPPQFVASQKVTIHE